MAAALTLDQPTTTPVTDPNAPAKPKPVTAGAAPALSLAPMTASTPTTAPGTASSASPTSAAPAAPMTTAAPLSTEYPSAPSTTGTPQNRLQLATTAFDTFAKSTDPAYQADLRSATQAAAGKGTIGSGGLRTTYGDLANQRALALDTEKENLINSATTGTIADQQAAQANAIAQQNANTSATGVTGNLALGQGQLSLAQTAQATSAGQTQQQIDLAKQQASEENALATAGLTGELNGTDTLAAKQQAINSAVAQGQLSVAQGQLALSQLAQSQGNTLAQGQLSLATTTEQNQNAVAQGNLQLAQQQLAQQASQFGLSLEQQKALATLADQTANRQIDVSSAQGQNTLLVQLANIIGGPSGNVDPNLLAALYKSLGLAVPSGGNASTQTPTPPPGATGTAGTVVQGGGKDSVAV